MTGAYLDPSLKEVAFNPTYETMFSPEVHWNIIFISRCLVLSKSWDISVLRFIFVFYNVVNETTMGKVINIESC